MKFWLCASLLLTAAAAGARISPVSASQAAVRHTNEILLAGLRPGRDTFAVAEKRFKGKSLSEEPNSSSREWRDDCSGRSIRLEVDAKSVIQSRPLF